MPDLSLLMQPSGIIWLTVLLLAVFVLIAATGRAVSENGRVQQALMSQAKRRALRAITVVIELQRRPESIFNLLDHLAAHHYKKLDVVVIMKPTAGKTAKAKLEKYRTTTELQRMTLVTFRKGMTDAALATQYAKGTVLLKLDPDMLLSDRFFERVSYGFAASKSALLVRRFRRPERTLVSGWTSLSSLWRSVFTPYSQERRQVIEGQLVAGVPVLKTVIRKGTDYTPEPLLYDDYGLDMTTAPLSNTPYSWKGRLIVAGIMLAVVALVIYLIQVTPRDLLAFIGWLTFAVYLISSIVLLAHLKGLGKLERFLVLALIPFYPLYLIYRGVYRLLQVDETPKRSRPIKQPTQPVTQ